MNRKQKHRDEIHNLGDIITANGTASRTSYIDLTDNARHFSLAEFDHYVDYIADQLVGSVLAGGSRIGILSFNCAEYLMLYFASMRAGMTPVPINYRLPKSTIEYLVSDADLETIFVDEAHSSLIPSQTRVRSLEKLLVDAPEKANAYIDFESKNPNSQTACKVLYTSGTTGQPKGTLLTHDGQIWAIFQSLLDPPTPGSNVLVAAPYYHKNGLYFATYALAAGATVISQPRFNARAYLRAAADYQCQWLTGIPTMFAMLLRETDLINKLDLSAVQRISIGSAPLSDSLAAQIETTFPNAELVNGYGATEAGPLIFGKHPEGIPRPRLSVGFPAPGVDCRLSGPDSPNQGTLQIKSPAVMKGYLNKPELTLERMVDGWYDTGDVFRVDHNGFYFFVGRTDDMFVCGGENIYPAEVEKLLELHPAVAQAAVVAAEDRIKGEIPIGFVVLTRPRAATAQDLKKFALEKGPAYSHPRAIIIKDSLPVGGTHKLDRKALEREANDIVTGLGRT